MPKINYLSLDLRVLHTFLIIMETSSITASANQLNITQSAVSHSLDKLREIFQDPLFIRSGRGITPTPRAIEVANELRPLLKQIEALTAPTHFNPAEAELKWAVAANDFQRDLLMPAFYQRVSTQVADFSLHIEPSEIPTVNSLRDGDFDLILSPMAPDAPDVMQKRLFGSGGSCFYDANAREAPSSEADYKTARYISLTFMAGKNIKGDVHPVLTAIDQNVRIRVSNFAGLAEFLRGSKLLAIAPSLMINSHLKGFASVPFPYQSDHLSMYMLWHQRNQLDAVHHWLRQQLIETNKSLGLPDMVG